MIKSGSSAHVSSASSYAFESIYQPVRDGQESFAKLQFFPARFVSGEWVGRATWFHADVGQYLVIGLVVLHLLAIAYYTLVRRKTLVRPMLHGDKDLPTGVPASRDDALSRVAAALVLAACAALAWWVAGLGTV